MRNLHCRFTLCSNSQIYGGDFAKFWGFLRIYELYYLAFFGIKECTLKGKLIVCSLLVQNCKPYNFQKIEFYICFPHENIKNNIRNFQCCLDGPICPKEKKWKINLSFYITWYMYLRRKKRVKLPWLLLPCKLSGNNVSIFYISLYAPTIR